LKEKGSTNRPVKEGYFEHRSLGAVDSVRAKDAEIANTCYGSGEVPPGGEGGLVTGIPKVPEKSRGMLV